MDLTSAAGFIDSYTYDPDKPSGEKVLFLVYDDRVRNDYVTQRAKRFDSSSTLKRKYIKLVNHVPYYIYVFWIKPTIKISEKGTFDLTSHQKISVLQFWGFPDDLVELLVEDSTILGEYKHDIPLADYYPDEYVEEGFSIEKKGATS